MEAPSGAVCGKHPTTTAVVTCERCGDFCCDDCHRRVHQVSLCAACAALPTAQSPAVVNPFRRLWQLPLQPERFFAPSVRFASAATVVAAYLVGIGGSIESRGDTLFRQDLMSAGAAEYATISWSALWIGALVAAVFRGPLYYYVGGFWYGLRLRWSGVVGADRRGVRELNTYSDLILEMPYLLVMLAWTQVFDSFDQSWSEGPLHEPYVYNALALVVVLTSYRGAVARYGVRSVAGVLWFLVLPGLRCIAGIAFMYWAQTGALYELLEKLSGSGSEAQLVRAIWLAWG